MLIAPHLAKEEVAMSNFGFKLKVLLIITCLYDKNNFSNI